MCESVGKRGLGSEAETGQAAKRWCGACGAPVVDGRCTRGPEECWERSQAKKGRDAATGTKLPQLVRAVAVEWRRWHHHPEQQLIRLELIDALHAMAEHIGYPAFGPGGEDLPVEEREADPEMAAWPQTMRQLADEGPPSIEDAAKGQRSL